MVICSFLAWSKKHQWGKTCTAANFHFSSSFLLSFDLITTNIFLNSGKQNWVLAAPFHLYKTDSDQDKTLIKQWEDYISVFLFFSKWSSLAVTLLLHQCQKAGKGWELHQQLFVLRIYMSTRSAILRNWNNILARFNESK